MVLNPKESVICYRCPECGSTVMSMVGTFALSGDMVKLKCACQKSELLISYTKDRKIRLTVPCLACESPHVFSINSSTFFEKDLLTLQCKVLGLDICFAGNKEKVFEAVKKSDKELEELLGDYSAEQIGKIGSPPDSSMSDSQISDLVRFMLCEMKDENSIVCGCQDGGDYDFSINEDSVDVFCKKCGAKKTFDLNSVQKAYDFLEIDELDLRN